jgi:hypothetical protein
MTNEEIPLETPIKLDLRNRHLTCIKQPIDSKYAQELWYIVSGAVECGGLGGGSWGWRCHPAKKWTEYNNCNETEKYSETYPSVALQMMNYEDDEVMSDFIMVNAKWLHNMVVKFVNDKKMPNHLRAHYAELLVTRELPNNHDAVTCDALMQYAFVNEIVFG